MFFFFRFLFICFDFLGEGRGLSKGGGLFSSAEWDFYLVEDSGKRGEAWNHAAVRYIRPCPFIHLV